MSEEDNVTRIEARELDAIERDRMAAVNNAVAMLEQMKVNISSDVVIGLRLDTLIDSFLGEIVMDESGHFQEGTRERLTYERDVQQNLVRFLEAQREQIAAAQARGRLVLPGDMKPGPN